MQKPRTNARGFATVALRRRWCGHRDLNSDGVIHTPLKRTRLPVPPWPHSENSILLPRLFVNGFGTKCQEICAGNMMWYENRSCPLQRACGMRGGSAVQRQNGRRDRGARTFSQSAVLACKVLPLSLSRGRGRERKDALPHAKMWFSSVSNPCLPPAISSFSHTPLPALRARRECRTPQLCPLSAARVCPRPRRCAYGGQ